MNPTSTQLADLYKRIPRRHTTDNVKEINSILEEYEDLLQTIESQNAHYEKNIPPFFDALEPVRDLIKKSSGNKASKKMKDDFFDEGSGLLKDSMDALINLYNEGQKSSS